MPDSPIAQRDHILSLLHRHEALRKNSLNLVAAENAMSPIVRSQLSSDLAQRYGDYTGRDLRARRYLGTDYIAQLEIVVEGLAKEVFKAEFVELRPLSGHVAGNSVLMALCQPGDIVVELGRHQGGHRVATKLAATPVMDITVQYFPFDDESFNIDVQGTLDLVEKLNPRILLLGASNFLFPSPVRELADGLKDYPSTLLVYDASHVLGLIAGGKFQDPLKEGAQIVLGGTQKSFPGPQGGVIYSNSEDLIENISHAVHPAMISNHHLARLPSLGLALLEMKVWGEAYAAQVIRNAKALARSLNEQGISVVGANQGYTESHTVLINTASLGSNEELGVRLESADLIVTTVRLPQSMGGAGLRLGTGELTRRGATEQQMVTVAGLVADVLLLRRGVAQVRADVNAMAKELDGYAFTWS